MSAHVCLRACMDVHVHHIIPYLIRACACTQAKRDLEQALELDPQPHFQAALAMMADVQI